MLSATTQANFKNLNSTFGNFSSTFSLTWTTTTTQDTVMFYNGPKYFMPVEAFVYLVARTGTIGCSILAGNAAGSAIYVPSYLFTSLSVGSFASTVIAADSTTKVALAPGGALWVRLSGQNPSGASNSVTVKFFISGYYR
jgi:hypothetical protein